MGEFAHLACKGLRKGLRTKNMLRNIKRLMD